MLKNIVGKFRPGLNDFNIFHTASELNEYRLPDKLEKDDVIIDIGSHIGGFIYGCIKRGSRNIYAYESFKPNYDIALSIFDDEIKSGFVRMYNLAVWRSDIDNPVTLLNSGFCDPRNSGTNVVVYDTDKNNPVNTISLDEIIDSIFGELDNRNTGSDRITATCRRRIKLIKIDCEGSEFPILFTSKRLKEVDYICGEYHMIDLFNFNINGKSKFSELDLVDYLDSQGFVTKIYKNPINKLIGMFYAKRKTLTDNFYKGIKI